MQLQNRISLTTLALTMILSLAAFSNVWAMEENAISKGEKIAFDRKKGNCLACHFIKGGVSPGNIGPPLVAIKAKFPNKTILRDRIWDATAINPDTRMPPFGRNRILSEDEINLVLTYLYTL